MIEKTTLPNGVRVVTAAAPSSYSTALSLYFGVGSRYEEASQSGISHYLEHMLFKGTLSRPTARQVSETVEGVGGVLNAGTGREYTVYWSKLPADYSFQGFELLADMTRNSLLVPEEVERERGVILEEIKGREDSPGRLVSEMMDQLLWTEQPLGRPVAGTEQTVRDLQRSDLLWHLERHYRSDNLVVSCAGPVAHERVVEWASNAFGTLQPGAQSVVSPAVPTSRPGAALAGKPVKQATFSLAFPAISYNDPRRYALNVIDALLGGGMSSRLFLEVRERRGLAYSVGSHTQQYADDGAFVVHASVSPDTLRQSFDAVYDQLRRVCSEPLEAEDLARLKRYIKGRTVMGLEGSRGLASWAGSQELLRGRVREPDEVLKQVEAVTREDVLSLASEVFAGSPSLAVVGPFEDIGEIESLLRPL